VKQRPAAVIFIFITVMLDMLGIGLVAPVLPTSAFRWRSLAFPVRSSPAVSPDNRGLDRRMPRSLRRPILWRARNDDGFAPTGAWYIASIPVISVWNIPGPAAQGMMTHRVSEREQGELQGAISSLRSLAVLIGPSLFTLTFSFFIEKNRGLNMDRKIALDGQTGRSRIAGDTPKYDLLLLLGDVEACF
jgi:hypothetical protein